MSRTKKFIFGAVALNLKNLIIGLTGIFITPILLYYLGKTEYGLWILIGNVLGYINLLDFGITGSSNTIIAHQIHNENKLSELTSDIFFLQSLIGFIVLLFGFATYQYFPAFFDLKNGEDVNVKIVFLLTVTSLAISFPLRTYASILIGHQLIHYNAIIEFIIFIIRIVVQILLLYLGYGLISLPIALIGVKIFTFLIYFFIVKHKFPEIKLSPKLVTVKGIKSIFSVSYLWFLGSISAMVIYASDNILIGKYIGAEAIVVYSLTLRLVEFIRQRLYSINKSVMPGLGEMFGLGEIDKIANIYLKTQKLVWVFALLAFQVIYLFNQDFVKFWVGDEFFTGRRVNTLFALYLFMTIIFHSSSIIISSSLNIKSISLFRTFEAFLNILLSLYFIQKYGYLGLIGSTVFSLFFTNFWFAPYKVMKILNISFGSYWNSVMKKILPFLLLYITLDLIVYYYNLWSINLFLRIFMVSTTSIATVWLVDKRFVINFYNKIFK